MKIIHIKRDAVKGIKSGERKGMLLPVGKKPVEAGELIFFYHKWQRRASAVCTASTDYTIKKYGAVFKYACKDFLKTPDGRR